MRSLKLLLLFLLPYCASAQLNWSVQDISFSAGDTVRAEFQVFGFDSIAAYQFAMKFDTGALAFLGVSFPPANPLGLDAGDFGFYQVGKGILRHLWSNPYSQSVPDGSHIFTYIFKAKTASALSAKLWLQKTGLNPPLYPVAYDYFLNWMPLNVSFFAASEFTDVDDIEETNVRVYPNPNSGAVTVESVVPVSVEIFNVAGQVTHRSNGVRMDFFSLEKGANQIRITDQGKTLTKTIITQ